MQIVASFYPKCAISQNMKSQGRSVLQRNAKKDLYLISKFFFVLIVYRTRVLFQRNSNTTNKVWLFSGL